MNKLAWEGIVRGWEILAVDMEQAADRMQVRQPSQFLLPEERLRVIHANRKGAEVLRSCVAQLRENLEPTRDGRCPLCRSVLNDDVLFDDPGCTNCKDYL